MARETACRGLQAFEDERFRKAKILLSHRGHSPVPLLSDDDDGEAPISTSGVEGVKDTNQAAGPSLSSSPGPPPATPPPLDVSCVNATQVYSPEAAAMNALRAATTRVACGSGAAAGVTANGRSGGHGPRSGGAAAAAAAAAMGTHRADSWRTAACVMAASRQRRGAVSEEQGALAAEAAAAAASAAAAAGLSALAGGSGGAAAPAESGAAAWVQRAACLTAQAGRGAGRGKLAPAQLLHLAFNGAGPGAVVAAALGTLPSAAAADAAAAAAAAAADRDALSGWELGPHSSSDEDEEDLAAAAETAAAAGAAALAPLPRSGGLPALRLYGGQAASATTSAAAAAGRRRRSSVDMGAASRMMLVRQGSSTCSEDSLAVAAAAAGRSRRASVLVLLPSPSPPAVVEPAHHPAARRKSSSSVSACCASASTSASANASGSTLALGSHSSGALQGLDEPRDLCYGYALDSIPDPESDATHWPLIAARSGASCSLAAGGRLKELSMSLSRLPAIPRRTPTIAEAMAQARTEGGSGSGGSSSCEVSGPNTAADGDAGCQAAAGASAASLPGIQVNPRRRRVSIDTTCWPAEAPRGRRATVLAPAPPGCGVEAPAEAGQEAGAEGQRGSIRRGERYRCALETGAASRAAEPEGTAAAPPPPRNAPSPSSLVPPLQQHLLTAPPPPLASPQPAPQRRQELGGQQRRDSEASEAVGDAGAGCGASPGARSRSRRASMDLVAAGMPPPLPAARPAPVIHSSTTPVAPPSPAPVGARVPVLHLATFPLSPTRGSGTSGIHTTGPALAPLPACGARHAPPARAPPHPVAVPAPVVRLFSAERGLDDQPSIPAQQCHRYNLELALPEDLDSPSPAGPQQLGPSSNVVRSSTGPSAGLRKASTVVDGGSGARVSSSSAARGGGGGSGGGVMARLFKSLNAIRRARAQQLAEEDE
ncbi:hypothetical protein HYH03_003307 [Edaphochlamys debaryana]|uniref:Uncharacterized protein n=1 Tax=Edaphochlamys debaryana TaxID=47281 RepID=A0A835Y9M9_9CHLO|nr:hypothetical protein HYH03_003307 [Edaphochlamys debaryana]|eukprot:KAG2498556.1 hypothetical protein HYH03_003307 [Edaphochlamys debaryana]